MHNEQLVDPTNFFVKQIKLITDKGSKKMTISDHENRDRFEWEGGLYWCETRGPIIPGDNIEACIRDGARKARLGTTVEAAMWATKADFKLDYDGPRNKDKLYKIAAIFLKRKSVVIGKSRIMRCRPMFPTGWKLTFSVEYDETVVNGKDIVKAMRDAGALCGLGDWRPKFGRFTVEILTGGDDDGVEVKPEDTEPKPVEPEVV